MFIVAVVFVVCHDSLGYYVRSGVIDPEEFKNESFYLYVDYLYVNYKYKLRCNDTDSPVNHMMVNIKDFTQTDWFEVSGSFIDRTNRLYAWIVPVLPDTIYECLDEFKRSNSTVLQHLYDCGDLVTSLFASSFEYNVVPVFNESKTKYMIMKTYNIDSRKEHGRKFHRDEIFSEYSDALRYIGYLETLENKLKTYRTTTICTQQIRDELSKLHSYVHMYNSMFSLYNMDTVGILCKVVGELVLYKDIREPYRDWTCLDESTHNLKYLV